MKTVNSPNLRAGDQVYSVVLREPRRFAKGGLVKAATAVRGAGRYGDDVLVHMNRAEFEQIKKAWGQPTVNPKTGLPEYFSLGSLGGWVPAVASLALGLLGSKHSGGNSGVNPAPPSDPNLTARLPNWTNQRTVVPHTNPSDYFTYGQTSNPHPGEMNFFNNNSLGAVGAAPPPAAQPPPGPGTNPPGLQHRPVMGGGPFTRFAVGGPVQAGGLGQAAPPMLGTGSRPPPISNPQFGAMAAPPPGGPLPPPPTGLGGAGSMPGSSMALQRPQGPAGAPALGGMGQGYARPQMGMQPWQGPQAPGQQHGFAGGGQAVGPGTGRSDDIHAKLSDGEYVIDAETVSLLGDGSTNAGASRLDEMRKAIRSHKGPALSKGKFTPKARMPLDYLNDMAARDDMNRNLHRGIK